MANSYPESDNKLLIYHAGISCKTDYDPGGSSSTPWKALDGFKDHWGIKTSANVQWRIWHLSNWLSMLKSEINNGRPVLYSGGGLIGNGNSWVLDGYDDQDLFYCNWGWGGNHNGWYSLGGFDPPGEPGPYNQYESGIFGVEPIEPVGVGDPELSTQDFIYNPSGYSISVEEPFGATSYIWQTEYGTITGSTNDAHLASNRSTNISVKAYNSLCNIYSATITKPIYIEYGPIDGNSTLCSSGSNYCIQNVPGEANITWDVTPQAFFNVYSGNGSNIYLVPKGNVNGNAEITFHVNINGYNADVGKDIWVGIPAQPTTNPTGYPTVQMSLGQLKTIYAASGPGATNYSWNATGSITRVSSPSGPQMTVEATSLGSGQFYCYGENICGTSSSSGGGAVYVSNGGGGGLLAIPNPAYTDIEIRLDEDTYKNLYTSEIDSEKSQEKLLRIINSNGIQVYSNNTFEKSIRLNFSHLKSGLYTALFIYGTSTHKSNFVIN